VILGVFDNWPQLIEVVGIWFAGIATFTAAVVALRVANRANAQDVRLVARPMLEVTVGGGEPKKVFHVAATNVGHRKVTITHLGARSLFKFNSFVLTTGLPGNSPVPTHLEDGEVAHWRFPELRDDGKNWYGDFAKRFEEYNWLSRWVLLRSFRYLIVTSLGNTFLSKPSKEFRKKVYEQMEKDPDK